MLTFRLTEKSPNKKSDFNCDICHYTCSKKSDFDKHLLTLKHVTAYRYLQNGDTNSPKKYNCNCGKEYSFRQSLYNHRKICREEVNVLPEATSSNDDMIHLLIKENSEFKKENTEFKSLLMEMMQSNTELMKQMVDLSKGAVNINSHNKTSAVFNMQLFLNEQCKHAMNIKEFVDSIRLTLDDFEMVGEKGLIEGLSNIIIKSLKATDKYLRPIHCSDAKRDVMYVKDNDKWEKEGPRNDKVRMLVQNVEHKNIRLLNEYSKVHPDSLNPESPLNDHYLQLSSTATSGTDEHLDKIITKLAKETVVDK